MSVALLGAPPLGKVFKIFGIVAAIPFVLYFVIGGKSGLMAYVIALVFLGIPSLILFPAMLGAAIRGNRFYKPAVRAVRNAEIYASFVGRGFTCKGIAVVDEPKRKIYINGGIYDFSDVESIGVGCEEKLGYLDFMLKKGTSPTQRVLFDSELEAQNFRQRLFNAMRG
jgi:hypothetical protein